jgi:hypothetical protein
MRPLKRTNGNDGETVYCLDSADEKDGIEVNGAGSDIEEVPKPKRDIRHHRSQRNVIPTTLSLHGEHGVNGRARRHRAGAYKSVFSSEDTPMLSVPAFR